MENRENKNSEENLGYTDTKLIRMYQEVLEKLNRIRDEKKGLVDEQSKLKIELALNIGKVSDLEEQLSKINKSRVVNKNNRYIKKIEELKHAEECCLCQSTYIINHPYRDYDVRKDYPCTNPKVLKHFGKKFVDFCIPFLIFAAVVFTPPLILIILNAPLELMIIFGVLCLPLIEIPYGIADFFEEILLDRYNLTSTKALQRNNKLLKKINKKQDKYKKKLEKKYGVSYDEIDNNAIELKKEQILESLQESKGNIDTLSAKIIENKKIKEKSQNNIIK